VAEFWRQKEPKRSGKAVEEFANRKGGRATEYPTVSTFLSSLHQETEKASGTKTTRSNASNSRNRRSYNMNVYRRACDRLCGLGVRVPGYTTEMYYVSCEVRTECIYVM
jgi:hypothetical protein